MEQGFSAFLLPSLWSLAYFYWASRVVFSIFIHYIFVLVLLECCCWLPLYANVGFWFKKNPGLAIGITAAGGQLARVNSFIINISNQGLRMARCVYVSVLHISFDNGSFFFPDSRVAMARKSSYCHKR